MKKHIPNAITCCNLICGCLAVGSAFASTLSGEYRMAFALIVLGAVFDFFDGFMARLLGVSGPMGKELDSLADVITFGFAPSAIAFSLLVHILPEGPVSYLAFAAFLIAAFSALRLAKFNIDTRQSMGFIGLPTPANALFWGSLAMTLSTHAEFVNAHAQWVWVALLAGVLFSCWILVSEVPMFALKFHDYSWAHNRLRYSFMLLSALLLVALQWAGFAVIIVLYVLLSVWQTWHASCK
ncbi:MAG: CDP-diacylglycerol--serine O-phosphatidyltransferase [Bacteroidaceae bacterium]|nr:CDP-diacylglycerol--serine O-phosphatidyltransferase [Bacteroidaceae bacterium]